LADARHRFAVNASLLWFRPRICSYVERMSDDAVASGIQNWEIKMKK